MFQGEGFDVMKSGDARVALIGFPSVGKVGQMCAWRGRKITMLFTSIDCLGETIHWNVALWES